jgi:hypothetical protein
VDQDYDVQDKPLSDDLQDQADDEPVEDKSVADDKADYEDTTSELEHPLDLDGEEVAEKAVEDHFLDLEDPDETQADSQENRGDEEGAREPAEHALDIAEPPPEKPPAEKPPGADADAADDDTDPDADGWLQTPDPTAPSSSLNVATNANGQLQDRYGGIVAGRTTLPNGDRVQVVVNRTYERPDPGPLDGTIRFAVSNPHASEEHIRQTHWVQFVWTEVSCMTDRGRMHLGGTYGNGMEISRDPSHPSWRVDTLAPTGLGQNARPIIPWYDYPTSRAEGAGATDRTPHSVEIIDRPGPIGAGTTSGIVTALLNDSENQSIPEEWRNSVRSADIIQHFDTYLVQTVNGRTQAVAHTEWSATHHTDFQGGAQNQPAQYSTEPTERVHGLPTQLRSVLRQEFGRAGYDNVR